MGQRHSRAHFDLHSAMLTAAKNSAWAETPPAAQEMLEDAFFTGAYCVFHALTDGNIDAVARLSIISQLSEQFDEYMKRRSGPKVEVPDHDPDH